MVIVVVAGVQAGFGAFYFTNGRWLNGIACVVAVALLATIYIRHERKLKGQGGGRRY